MGFLEDRDLSGVPSIPEFYKGKTIFITGASGFMGKVLLEKLLYSCPDLERIYLLLRSKKGVRPEDRLEQLYSSQCFERLRQENPKQFKTKVNSVAGDVLELGLGLSDEDRALLVDRVHIVFHVAASVRFDDPLSYAVKMNLRGTKEMVDLAKEMKNLLSFVHVSTTYCNTNRDLIEEVLYPPLCDWRNTLAVCDNIDDHTLKVLTPKYLGELPNTYTFSKQLAEHVVYEQRGVLPIVIIRPSIVVSSISEPEPGWVENFNGPVGIIAAIGKGVMRTLYCDADVNSDYIPVDASIKSFIAAAWIRGTKPMEKSDDIAIYNSCCGTLRSFTIRELFSMGERIREIVPLDNILWVVRGTFTASKTIHYIKVILYHLLPAIFVDTLLWISGRKTLLVKIQRRIYIANMALEYFMTQQWLFDNKNLLKLRSIIKKEDFDNFYYDFESYDKLEYFLASSKVAKKYLMKDKDEDLPKTKALHFKLNVLDKIIWFLVYGAFIWWLINTNFVQNNLRNVFF